VKMNWKILGLLFFVSILLFGGLTFWFVSILKPKSVQVVSAKWAGSRHADRRLEPLILWDDADPAQIPIDCARCHSTYGFLDFVGEEGTAADSVQNEGDAEDDSIISCNQCHAKHRWAKVVFPSGDEIVDLSVVSCNACHDAAAQAFSEVVFPSGDEIVAPESEASCMQCHQGRESTLSVSEAISGLPDDEVSSQIGFISVHYGVAAATLMGSEVQGAYQYDGQEYGERFGHVRSLSTCTDCHDPHSLEVDAGTCSPCHVNVVDDQDFESIRTGSAEDWDGDGDSEEGVAGEIDSLSQLLYLAIQEYSKDVIGTPIVYSGEGFPFFLVDGDGDGQPSLDESKFDNQFAEWTPRLLRAAYNYHFVQEDPGSYAHNPDYIIQVLYDSLRDLGERVAVDTSVMSRPMSRP